MELRCPHCQNPLTIEDQYAGQLMRCPTCNGTFQAPALLSPTNETWVAPPPDQSPSPAPGPTPAAAEPPRVRTEAPAPASTIPGDYSRTYTLLISGRRLLPWIAPVGLSVILLLSFFPWIALPGADLLPGLPGAPLANAQPNMWQLAFGDPPRGLLAMFVILALFLAWPLSIVSVLISMRIIPTPPPLNLIASFRSIVVGALALAAFVFFAIFYMELLLGAFNPSTLAIKLAFRIALVVAGATLLQFWLERRQLKNLPPPQITVRW